MAAHMRATARVAPTLTKEDKIPLPLIPSRKGRRGIKR